MGFDEEILELGKKIYEKIWNFVQANKGDDDKYYENCYLRLPDGRAICLHFSGFDTHKTSIRMTYTEHHPEYMVFRSDYLTIIPQKSTRGFLVRATLNQLNKTVFDFMAIEGDSNEECMLTAEEKEKALAYFKSLYGDLDELQYDDAMHSVDNLRSDIREMYKANQYEEAIRQMAIENPEAKVIPAIETAVNWWINAIICCKSGASIGEDAIRKFNTPRTSYFSLIGEEKIAEFRNILTQKIKAQLRNGKDVTIETVGNKESLILRSALTEAHIDIARFKDPICMIISADNVHVSLARFSNGEYNNADIYDNTKVENKKRVRRELIYY